MKRVTTQISILLVGHHAQIYLTERLQTATIRCNTRSQKYKLEREYGVRNSVLLELPYFDAPRMCIVDPMHNLLLGTAKRMIELWKSLHIISPKQYDEVQERVDSHVCPSDIGRVPSKIASFFSGSTAEQLKNWTLFFSLFSPGADTGGFFGC